MLFPTIPSLAGHAAIFCSFSDCQPAADSNDQQGDLQSSEMGHGHSRAGGSTVFLHFQGRDHVFAL